MPSWTVDASASGVLLTADRGRDRTKTYNVVVVNSELADGTPPLPPLVMADEEATSPTFVGGPFGRVPYFYSSPLLTSVDQQRQAGQAILTRVSGLNAQMTLTAVPNRALDVMDTVDVLLDQERYDIARPVERHLIDRITHPLGVGDAQQIDTRSTRTDTL